MPILAICQDSNDAPRLRKELAKAHLDYIEAIIDAVCVAGPMTEGINDLGNNTDRNYNSSCFIYHTNDLTEAKKLLNNDPYVVGGVYKKTILSQFNPAAGTWIGGITW